MDGPGMTDIQFKSCLKHLLARLERAKDQEDKDAIRAGIEALTRDLREDLRG